MRGRKLRVAVGAVVLGLVATACGGGDDGGDAGGAAAEGGEFSVEIGEPESLIPQNTNEIPKAPRCSTHCSRRWSSTTPRRRR
jgi:oligopeptide transport system substrate-binding protein